MPAFASVVPLPEAGGPARDAGHGCEGAGKMGGGCGCAVLRYTLL
jgi:hypothetical protein